MTKNSFVEEVTFKRQFHKMVGKLPTNCLSVIGHFVGLALKGLKALFVFKVFKFLS